MRADHIARQFSADDFVRAVRGCMMAPVAGPSGEDFPDRRYFRPCDHPVSFGPWRRCGHPQATRRGYLRDTMPSSKRRAFLSTILPTLSRKGVAGESFRSRSPKVRRRRALVLTLRCARPLGVGHGPFGRRGGLARTPAGSTVRCWGGRRYRLDAGPVRSRSRPFGPGRPGQDGSPQRGAKPWLPRCGDMHHRRCLRSASTCSEGDGWLLPLPGTLRHEDAVGRYPGAAPRNALAQSVARSRHAAMDVSDGLAVDLAKLCAAPRLGRHRCAMHSLVGRLRIFA